MNRNIERFQTIWKALGVHNPRCATEAEIATLERTYNVTLTPVVRDYFKVLNGTAAGKLGMDDGRLVGFWHIDEIRPLNEECPELARNVDTDLFVFADYSIWALAYAVRLGTGQNFETPVFLVGGSDQPLQIASTFDDFLRKYAAGDQEVVFPKIS